MDTIHCPHFQSCGGCQFLNIPYEKQKRDKLNVFQKSLRKLWIKTPENVNIFGDTPIGYRNRMDFVWTEKGIGLKAKNSHKNTVAISKCLIANDPINLNIPKLNSWFFAHPKLSVFSHDNPNGLLKHAVIRHHTNSKDESITLIINKQQYIPDIHIPLFNNLPQYIDTPNIIIGLVDADKDFSVTYDYIILKGNAHLYETIDGKIIYHHGQSFFQNNIQTFTSLITHLKQYIQTHVPKHSHLLDIFSGSGIFSVLLSSEFKNTTLLELDELNVKLAQKNMNDNHIQATILQEDLYKKEFFFPTAQGDTIAIIDPPRNGLPPSTITPILNLGCQHIFYISCSPLQMLRELPLFYKQYDIIDIQLFDFFPQTKHFEALCILKKRDIDFKEHLEKTYLPIPS